MQPCVWELWLLSLRLFSNLAACCCADVLFESTCFSARCCCTQEDGQASIAGLTLYSSEQCRCSPWCISVSGDGLARNTEWLQKLLSLVAVPEDDLWWPLFLLFSPAFLFLLSSSCFPQCSRKMCRRDQLGLFPGRNQFICLIVLPRLFLLVVGSRDTMGGKAIKGLLLDDLFSTTVYGCINSEKTLALFNHLY